MDMLNVKINGIAVNVPKGSTVLEAARLAGVEIPTLCFMKEKNEIGAPTPKIQSFQLSQ